MKWRKIEMNTLSADKSEWIPPWNCLRNESVAYIHWLWMKNDDGSNAIKNESKKKIRNKSIVCRTGPFWGRTGRFNGKEKNAWCIQRTSEPSFILSFVCAINKFISTQFQNPFGYCPRLWRNRLNKQMRSSARLFGSSRPCCNVLAVCIHSIHIFSTSHSSDSTSFYLPPQP